MFEALLSTAIFWSTFAFSAGPFWTAVMEEAKSNSFYNIYKNYSIYFFAGWFPLIITIALVTEMLGQLNPYLFTALFFLGAIAMIYFAWRMLVFAKHPSKTFQFSWKAMTVLSWLNPKAWLTVPSGFLVAQYSDNLWLNMFIFYAVSGPIMYVALYLWGQLGRQGAKIAHDKITYLNVFLLVGFALYFNVFLLVGFALYLIYQGILEFQSLSL